MKRAIIVVALAALLLALGSAAFAQDDIIIHSGPRGDIQQLWRAFDGGAYEAQVVSLAPFDEATGAPIIIDVVHHEVHEGEMYHVEHTQATVANGNNLDVMLRTGAADSHMTFEILAGGQVTAYLYESPTFTATGTALTEYNMLRSSTDITPSTQFSHTPTVNGVGSTVLVNGRILPGGTSPTTRVGGGVRQGVEWILAPNTNYLIRATNTSGGNIAINVVAEWYEEE